MRTKISFHRNDNKYYIVYIDQHPGNNCVLFIGLFKNRHVSAIKKK
jgi:hypothetical protein